MRGPALSGSLGVLAVTALLAVGCSSDDGSKPTARSGAAGSGATTVATSLPPGEAATPVTTAPVPPTGPAAADATAPAPVRDPASAARTLVAAEQAIRNPATAGVELERAARAQQDAYRLVTERPEWTAQVLSLVPPSLKDTVQANVTAGIELRALTKPRTSLPPWRIVPPAPAQELLAHYRAAEEAIGIPWQYLAAIHLVETRMGRIRGTSVAGAQGPMQFLPATWRRYGKGGDINSTRDAVFAAARLLAANGGPGNMSGALYRYNSTPRYVKAVTAYAGQMKDDERAFLGYYHWQVYYRLVDGDRLLSVGYGS